MTKVKKALSEIDWTNVGKGVVAVLAAIGVGLQLTGSNPTSAPANPATPIANERTELKIHEARDSAFQAYLEKRLGGIESNVTSIHLTMISMDRSLAKIEGKLEK